MAALVGGASTSGKARSVPDILSVRLFVDDLVGTPSNLTVEDRRPVTLTSARLPQVESKVRRSDDAATRERWERLRALVPALVAAHPAVVVEALDVSAEDLRQDREIHLFATLQAPPGAVRVAASTALCQPQG